MRLFAILFLALSVVATGEGLVTRAGAAIVQSQVHESAEQAQGSTMVSRTCLHKSGIPVPGGIICQAEKRTTGSTPEVVEREWFLSRTSWPAAVSGNGIEPTPALDPPRLLS